MKDTVTHQGCQKEGSPTSLICWWCVHAFPLDPPIHLPIKYDSKLDRFSTIGNFCSWACAKAYALDMKTARSGEVQSFLAMMKRRAVGKYINTWPAPKREALKCFGGTMTIEEFRKFGGEVEPPRIHYPFEKLYFATTAPSGEVATHSTGVSSAPNTFGRLKAIETASAETDTLKLKRNKPLVRSTSKLENVLGLKRKEKV
jgi:MYM-type Zinc finger with FCS sequence motif